MQVRTVQVLYVLFLTDDPYLDSEMAFGKHYDLVFKAWKATYPLQEEKSLFIHLVSDELDFFALMISFQITKTCSCS